jgi:hypothetical protein
MITTIFKEQINNIQRIWTKCSLAADNSSQIKNNVHAGNNQLMQ